MQQEQGQRAKRGVLISVEAMIEVMQKRGEYPVTDPEKREAYAKGVVVGLGESEYIIPEDNPLFEDAVAAGGFVAMVIG